MPVDIYSADEQLDALKTILDVEEVKTELGIPLTIRTPAGVDTGNPNEYGVVIQNPYYVMPRIYLPQLVIDLQGEYVSDQQFNLADTTTTYHLYYVKEIQENDPTVVRDMYTKLRYLSRFLVSNYRTDQDYWYTMTLPRIEVVNEVSRYFSEATPRILLTAGRIVFDLKDRRTYR